MRWVFVLVLAAFLLAQPVNVVFILHNHQPWYIDLDRGDSCSPGCGCTRWATTSRCPSS